MQFFVMDDDLHTDDWTYYTDASRMNPDHLGAAPRCPVCNDFVGMLPWLPPYHVEIIARGRVFGDVAMESSNSLLVSDRFRRAWIDAKLVGIDDFAPLERVRIRPARLKKIAPTYFHVAPRLFDAQIDLKRSWIDYDRPFTCEKCMGGMIDSVRGFAIDETSWHGEDIFKAWGMCGVLIVSDRFRQLRDEHSLTNVKLTPIEEHLWDPKRKWTPFDYSYMDGEPGVPNRFPDEPSDAN